MKTHKPKRWSIGEFAAMTGVSIRTLRFYDRKGLLPPAEISDAGYRMYTTEEVVRLQYILMLKMLDYSLADIQRMLSENRLQHISATLQSQRRALEKNIERMQQTVLAIKQAEEHIEREGSVSWQSFQSIIQSILMKPSTESQEWMQQFYSDEQRAELAARNYSQEEAMKDAAVWNDLIAEVNAALDTDPASPQAQALADRWMALVGKFTQANPGMQQSLNNVWANADSAPSDFQVMAQRVKPAGEFIQKVMAARKQE